MRSWGGDCHALGLAAANAPYLPVKGRSFHLAVELGLADPGDVKKSAPPSIQLKTGAEVIFRSADEPDRPPEGGCARVYARRHGVRPATECQTGRHAIESTTAGMLLPREEKGDEHSRSAKAER